ncbi:UTRA domain-containing protein [Sphingomonas sp. G-3-2-10]|uniref:UTRA domain-containing protein n=1 Tax=Sphingomonas sp. G-3-2-10 TaxID=2728838 RepID=UPI00146EA494|nr:UTRA domain-containing protein [Sphingomonas sp. G-3-2-10]NML04885.1 UTRA domain-containing protein [Sphingomonas sp. G-3-2-10]
MTIEARIRGQIEARIRSGEWAPGTRIPFEHELVAEHGCARATVNKALSHLAREGLIERRRRAGSFVAQPRIRSAVVGVPDIGALIAARGETYRWELVSRAIDGNRLILTGVHHSGAKPFGWESRWLDLATVPEAAAIDFAVEAPGTWLLHSVPWTDARHRICATGAGRTEAQRLGIAPGAPCLQIERWTWRGDAPVTHATQLFPADHYDLVEDFTPRS